jgi:hypothetical protein
MTQANTIATGVVMILGGSHLEWLYISTPWEKSSTDSVIWSYKR